MRDRSKQGPESVKFYFMETEHMKHVHHYRSLVLLILSLHLPVAQTSREVPEDKLVFLGVFLVRILISSYKMLECSTAVSLKAFCNFCVAMILQNFKSQPLPTYYMTLHF